MNSRYLIFVMLCAGGCMVGPKFTPPVVETPVRYIDQTDTVSVALDWRKLFVDTTLQRLIDTAIEHNCGVEAAMSRIEQARLTLHATRSGLLPVAQYGLSGSFGNKGTQRIGGKPSQAYSIEPSVSWELDLFGRIRRAAEADRATLLSTDATAQGVLVSLVAEVATNYYSLLQYEALTDIAQRTANTQRETCTLIRQSYDLGNSNALDLQQASSAVATSNAAVAEYRRAAAQARHALCVLLRSVPGHVVGQHQALALMSLPHDIPTGLPSGLLARRPDMIEAYYNVRAANAKVGMAEAARLPSITLTGSGGSASDQIGKLLSHTTLFWSTGVDIAGPIFAFGANKRRAEAAREAWRESVINYRQCYLQALQEVEDALTGIVTFRTQCDQLQQAVQAAVEAARLALSQYQLGRVSYLNVLDAQRTLFTAQSSLSSCQCSMLSAYATLYKALGGGVVGHRAGTLRGLQIKERERIKISR